MATAFKESFDHRDRSDHSARQGISRQGILCPEPVLSAGYVPGPDDEFMNPFHRAYFRAKLTGWRDVLVGETRLTLTQLQADSLLQPDVSDRASSETDWGLELRTRDRQRKLIAKINAALRRLDTGEYGYCEATGEPIALARLEARPIATMTVEAQSRHERHEKISRED